MSATAGRIVRMQSPGESDLGPVSPELALIDPDLARSARERLPDPPPVGPESSFKTLSPRSPSDPPRSSRCPAVSSRRPCPQPHARRRFRLGLLTSAAGIVALGVLVTLIIGRDEQPTVRTQQTQSVAAALSPTAPTPTQPSRSAATPTTSAPATSTPTPHPGPGARDRGSRANVRLGLVPGRSGLRVPAVPGRRARLPSARGRSPTRASRSLATGGPPARAAAGNLPLVCMDDLQAHKSPVDQADGERKTRDRQGADSDLHAAR